LTLDDDIVVYNVSNAPTTFESVVVDVPGVEVDVNSFPTTLAPGESGLIEVSATRAISEALGQGTIFIEGSYLAGDNDLVSYTFNPSSVTSPYFAEGATTQLDYVLEPAVFDPNLDYTLTMTQPALLDWISLAADVAPTFPLTSETNITVTLTATAPTWLTLGETYSDTATMTLAGSDGEFRQNFLDIEVTKTTQGVKIHTTFRPGDIATVQKPLASTGLIDARFVSCGGGGGGPTNSSGSSGGWTWTPLPDGGGLRGTRQSSSGSSGGSPPFADVVNTSDAWVIGEADQQVRIQLNQRLMLAGEGFQANLTMQNLSLEAVDNIEVNLIISDTSAALVNASFVITPVVPTVLTDALPPQEQILGSWLIVPTESISDTEGKTYYATAEITYEIDEVSYSFTTLPEEFTVLPAPELLVEYKLPGPSHTCSTFDLEAIITNTGLGPARGVNISSGQPKLVESTSSTPQGFEIVAVSVEGQPLAELALEVILGDIPAGESRRIVWRMQTTDPGGFVEFFAGYHQIQNYVGLPLVAPRLTVSAEFTTPSDPFLYGCLTDAFTISGHVRDEAGNPVPNVYFFVGEGALSTSFTSTMIITPVMDATGAYTIPNVITGTYTLAPLVLIDEPIAQRPLGSSYAAAIDLAEAVIPPLDITLSRRAGHNPIRATASEGYTVTPASTAQRSQQAPLSQHPCAQNFPLHGHLPPLPPGKTIDCSLLFQPISQTVVVTTHVGGVSFTATATTISGQVTTAISPTQPISGVVISGTRIVSGTAQTFSATTQANGYYTMTVAISDTYILTPTLSGYTFQPITRTVEVTTTDRMGQNFVATGTLPITVEIFDPQGITVTQLITNTNGWPTPNPLTATVTLSCPSNGPDCSSPLTMTIGSPDNARFYAFNMIETNSSAGLPAVICSLSTQGSDSSYMSYTANCNNDGTPNLTGFFISEQFSLKLFLQRLPGRFCGTMGLCS
jgi:hypothetical protein